MSARTSRPPRPEEELAKLPILRVLRDYPEALAVLRAHGVALHRVASTALSRVASADAAGDASLMADVAAAIAWRGERCDG